MKIENLRTFLSVVHTKNIHKTAELLFTSAPNISYIIRNMEKELGCKLFVRDNKGMHLTKEGERFLAFIEPFVGKYDDFVLEIKSKNSPVIFRLFTTAVFEKYVKQIPGLLYSDDYFLSLEKRNVNEMLNMIASNQAGVYLIPVFENTLKAVIEHKEHVILAKDKLMYVYSRENKNATEKIDSKFFEKTPILVSSYYQLTNTAPFVLNIDDINTCKKYLREKNFCYRTTELIYNYEFTEDNEWVVHYGEENEIIEYYLVFVNFPKNQLELAKNAFVRLLQQFFKNTNE